MTFGDIIVIGVLILVVGLIIRGMLRDRRKGCSGCSGCRESSLCSGGCSGCSGKCSGCNRV